MYEKLLLCHAVILLAVTSIVSSGYILKPTVLNRVLYGFPNDNNATVEQLVEMVLNTQLAVIGVVAFAFIVILGLVVALLVLFGKNVYTVAATMLMAIFLTGFGMFMLFLAHTPEILNPALDRFDNDIVLNELACTEMKKVVEKQLNSCPDCSVQPLSGNVAKSCLKEALATRKASVFLKVIIYGIVIGAALLILSAAFSLKSSDD